MPYCNEGFSLTKVSLGPVKRGQIIGRTGQTNKADQTQSPEWLQTFNQCCQVILPLAMLVLKTDFQYTTKERIS